MNNDKLYSVHPIRAYDAAYAAMTYDEELIKEAQVYWKKGEEIPLDLAVKLMEMGVILEDNQGDL